MILLLQATLLPKTVLIPFPFNYIAIFYINYHQNYLALQLSHVLQMIIITLLASISLLI